MRPVAPGSDGNPRYTGLGHTPTIAIPARDIHRSRTCSVVTATAPPAACLPRDPLMGRLRCQVACSLDGYIAASDGSYDWIPSDPAIDFDALFAQFDTLVMGRTTYEGTGGGGPAGGKRIVVLSRTLRQETHPKATIISTDVEARVEALKRETERDRTRRST